MKKLTKFKYKNMLGINIGITMFIERLLKNIFQKTGMAILGLVVSLMASNYLFAFILWLAEKVNIITNDDILKITSLAKGELVDYILISLTAISILLIGIGIFIRMKKKDISIIQLSADREIVFTSKKYSVCNQYVVDLKSIISLSTRDITLLNRAIDTTREMYNNFNCEVNYKTGFIAIAPIPIVSYLGYLIGDNGKLMLFENIRKNNLGTHELGKFGIYPKLNIVSSSKCESNEAILSISISNKVLKSEIPLNIEEYNYIELKSDLLNYFETGFDSVLSLNQVNNYVDIIHQEVTRLKKKCGVNKVYIFYAGPTTAIFELGRRISKTYDPDIVLYNYLENSYPWSLNIKTGIVEVTDYKFNQLNEGF